MAALALVGTTAALAASQASAQMTANAGDAGATNATPVVEESGTNQWAFSASLYTYFLPEEHNYVQPTFSADHDWLHLEARYQYENLETGSVWVGYNFSFGDRLTLDITPMLGGVFGDTTGIAPGYEIAASYWKIQFSTEGEFVFDTRTREGSFFYTWSELSYAPAEWIRAGVVVQRTKAYHTDLDVQRGLLVGLSYKDFEVTTYVFNPDENRPTVVLGVGWSF